MKRKIEKFFKDGTPAQFKLRCGSTVKVAQETTGTWHTGTEGDRGVIITITDLLAFASTGEAVLPVFGYGDYKTKVTILAKVKGLKSLAKILNAFVEVA